MTKHPGKQNLIATVNPGIIITLWVIGLLLLSACEPQRAHPSDEVLPSPPPLADLMQITLNEPLVLALDENERAAVVYMGEGPIRVQAAPILDSEPLDVVLLVLDANFNQIAYNDGTSEGLEQIAYLPLKGPAPYIIQIDSFNGLQAGEVEVTVSEPEADNDSRSLEVNLRQGATYHYELAASAGMTYTVTARALDEDRDLWLSVYDAEGNLIFNNDDHHRDAQSSEDESLGPRDAQVGFSVAADELLTIDVGEYLGRAVQLMLEITPTGS